MITHKKIYIKGKKKRERENPPFHQYKRSVLLFIDHMLKDELRFWGNQR